MGPSSVCGAWATSCVSTVLNELRRGTSPRKSNRSRVPGYSAKRGETVYTANRNCCKKPRKIDRCATFIDWVKEQVREHQWPLDSCAGYAGRRQLFKEDEMVSTKALYNELWAGRLQLTLFEVPEALKRRCANGKHRGSKRPKGRSIKDRPAIVDARTEMGQWEADTVVGRRNGKENVVFTLVSRMTSYYIAMRIPANQRGDTWSYADTARRVRRTVC